MIFHLAPSITSASVPVGPAAILVKDGWDDWFEFETMYILYYLDEEGAKHRVENWPIWYGKRSAVAKSTQRF